MNQRDSETSYCRVLGPVSQKFCSIIYKYYELNGVGSILLKLIYNAAQNVQNFSYQRTTWVDTYDKIGDCS